MRQVGSRGETRDGVPSRTADPGRGVQRQARALGDPTRFAIFEHVAGASAPVRVATLTGEFGLNHNAIRQHLAKLCDAGLLVEELAARSGPGRPALQYRVAPGIPGTWSTHGPYEQLALLLLALAVRGQTPREVGQDAGRDAASIVDSGKPGSVRLLIDEMQRRGFEPRPVNRGVGTDVILDHCPFATAAMAEPGIICEIHRGLAEGFLEGVGGDVQVTKLVLRNPARAGCRMHLRPAATAGDQG